MKIQKIISKHNINLIIKDPMFKEKLISNLGYFFKGF